MDYSPQGWEKNPHRTQEIISQPYWAEILEILEIKFGFMDHSPQGWEIKPSHAVAIPQKRFPRSINPAKKVAGENNFRSSGSRAQSQASLSYAEMKERRRSQDLQDLRRRRGKENWIYGSQSAGLGEKPLQITRRRAKRPRAGTPRPPAPDSSARPPHSDPPQTAAGHRKPDNKAEKAPLRPHPAAWARRHSAGR